MARIEETHLQEERVAEKKSKNSQSDTETEARLTERREHHSHDTRRGT